MSGKIKYVIPTAVEESKQLNADFKETVGELCPKKGIRLTHYVIENLDIYVTFLIGLNDQSLLKLAKESSFPRGYSIVWKKGELISQSGFHPKFSNDDGFRGSNDLQSIKKSGGTIEVTIKESGHLVGLALFKYQENIYVYFSSKNSADINSKFVQNSQRLFKQQFSEKNLETLFEQGVRGLYGECLAFNDQVHGYPVFQEKIYITCVCYQNLKRISGKDILESGIEKQYCIQSYEFSGEEKNKFLDLLEKHRDNMDYIVWQEIFGFKGAGYGKSKIMEGLVIKDQLIQKTIKYKFQKYTRVTMIFREWVQLGADLKNLPVESYLKRWVSYDIDYYRGVLYCIAEEIKNLLLYADENKMIDGVAVWILANENIEKKIDEGFQIEPIEPPKKIEEECHIYIFLGPVGSGKSTSADELKKMTKNSVHIDGDRVYNLSIKEVELLGKEREVATISDIFEKLVSNKVLIISCGGGVLLNLQERLNKSFLSRFHFKCFFAGKEWKECVHSDEFCLEDEVYKIYEDKNILRSALQKRGEECTEKRMEHSLKNFDVVKKLLSTFDSYSIGTFPVVIDGKTCVPDWLKKEVENSSICKENTYNVHQLRKLYFLNNTEKTGHETDKYSEEGFPYVQRYCENLNRYYLKPATRLIKKCDKGINNGFEVSVFEGNKGEHITNFSRGIFRPAEMRKIAYAYQHNKNTAELTDDHGNLHIIDMSCLKTKKEEYTYLCGIQVPYC